jgi:hypothetical protein
MTMAESGVILFHHVCATIMIHQDEPALEWCVNYAIAGSTMDDTHACYIQALYVQSNLDDWKGDEAIATRDLLGKAISQLKVERY